MNLRNVSGASAVILLICCGTAQAGARDDVLEAMGKCAAITADKDRLACYDALTPRAKDALAAPPEKLASQPTPDQQKSWFGFDMGDLFGGGTGATQTTPQQFGSESTPTVQAQEETVEKVQIQSISAGLTDYSFTPFGKFIIFLDNGQIWRQQEGDADKAHFLSNPKDNKVLLTRGAFGSYNLQINDSHHQYKVTRVK
jgi:hypothetical protein